MAVVADAPSDGQLLPRCLSRPGRPFVHGPRVTSAAIGRHDSPMELTVLEHSVVGTRGEAGCADILVRSPTVVGIADGATAKPWDDPGGPSGREIAFAVAKRLATLTMSATARDAANEVTAGVAEMLRKAGIAPGRGSAAAFAVAHLGARQIWRVGEALVSVDGRRWARRASGEEIVANARALMLHASIAHGASIDDLRMHDLGRESVEGLLRALVNVRNREVATYANAAVDGLPIPRSFIEVYDLPDNQCEVVIASDGFTEPAPSLRLAEELLHDRLRRDPLMIGDPPATKGWMIGQNSFDDRCYIRLLVPARASDTQ